MEIVTRRDRLRFEPAPRTAPPESAAEATRRGETYRQANDPCWVRQSLDIPAGEFVASLRLPPEAEGPAHVRVFVSGTADFAAGAADLTIAPPAGEESAANQRAK